MSKFAFEIVSRRNGRFSWRLVELDSGRRDVVLRAKRRYPSKKKTRKAIVRAAASIVCADIVDTTGSDGGRPFPLPTTSFRLVPSVIPLLVEGAPVDYRPADAQRGRLSIDGRPGSAARV